MAPNIQAGHEFYHAGMFVDSIFRNIKDWIRRGEPGGYRA